MMPVAIIDAVGRAEAELSSAATIEEEADGAVGVNLEIILTVKSAGVALLHDLAYGVPAAQPFFPARTWQDVARDVDAHNYPREELARVLERSALSFHAPPPVIENIRSLKQPASTRGTTLLRPI